MNKRIPFLIAGFIALGVSFAQIRPKNVVDEVIWVVGDSPILLSDVEGFRVNAEAGGQTFKDPYAEIPEQLAIQKLFLHQAELDSITVSDEQAKMMADYRLEENIRRYGSKEALEAAYHKTPDSRNTYAVGSRILPHAGSSKEADLQHNGDSC